MISAELRTRIGLLLAKVGAGEVTEAEPCSSGRNNRTYRVVGSNSVFAVKEYFRHEDDRRDRLGTEYSFLTYAADAAPGWTPSPLALDREGGIALYEFIDGRPLRPDEIGWEHVSAAVQFFRALNSNPERMKAKLPLASESCFSFNDHIGLIDARLKALRAIEPRSEEDFAARRLLTAVDAHWRELADDVLRGAKNAGLSASELLDSEQRCLSPSDFGFHNALLGRDGAIRFLDFEYAGWDDPAKMTGDFFAQLAVPAPPGLFKRFTEEALAILPRPGELVSRAHLLRPVYQVKWCCIALNVFHPTHLARRQFSDPSLDITDLKRRQLAKAQALFNSMETRQHGLH